MSTPHDLPPAAVQQYASLGSEGQRAFNAHFNARKRSMPLMMALAIIFPIQLFFLGKVVLGILFIVTGGGFGVWYVIEWFLTPQRVRDYNTKVAGEALAIASAKANASSDEE
jgi:hypothetical protein